MRTGQKINRAVNDGKVEQVKQELRFTTVDAFCDRRLFSDEYPFPTRLLEALVHAPLVREEDIDKRRKAA